MYLYNPVRSECSDHRPYTYIHTYILLYSGIYTYVSGAKRIAARMWCEVKTRLCNSEKPSCMITPSQAHAYYRKRTNGERKSKKIKTERLLCAFPIYGVGPRACGESCEKPFYRGAVREVRRRGGLQSRFYDCAGRPQPAKIAVRSHVYSR